MRKLRKPSTYLQLSRIRNMLEGSLTCKGPTPKISLDMPDPDKVDLMGMKPNGEIVLLGQVAMPAEMKAKETIRGLIGYGDFDDDGSDHSMWLYAFTEYAKWLKAQSVAQSVQQPAPAVMPRDGRSLQQLPPSVYTHPVLGQMWDRIAMHSYAVRHMPELSFASVHDKQEQEYIGTRLRCVAKAAGVPVDYGNDAAYYAGAFSILGDIARALNKAAASVQPETDILRDMLAIQDACGLHTDDYAPGSVIEYIKELEADSPKPDSGRDAALPKLIPRAPWDGENPDGMLESDDDYVAKNMELVVALLDRAAHPANVAQVGHLSQQHLDSIEEAAQALESAAAYNRSKHRTVLAHMQQDRADRLRSALAAVKKVGAA